MATWPMFLLWKDEACNQILQIQERRWRKAKKLKQQTTQVWNMVKSQISPHMVASQKPIKKEVRLEILHKTFS